MKLETLNDLLYHELKDIYDAEHQLLQALPLMAETAAAMALKNAFNEHLQQTRTHVQRLEQVFDMLGRKAQRQHCDGMAGVINEGRKMIREDADPDVKDAGLISAAQRVEHYEIAAYGTARTYAAELGNQQICRLLQTTLDEEGQTDKKLTQIAETCVNLHAAQMAA